MAGQISSQLLKPGAERAGRFVFKTQRDAIAIGDLPQSVPHTNLPVAPEFVDDDGCVGALMSILWSKNHQHESCKGLHLPDTVFYRYRCPMHWFFTAADGQTKRKHKAHVTSQQIYSGFTKGFADPRAIVALHIAQLSVEGEWPPKTKVEHLTAEELWEFLFHRDHKDDGLLQRFVPPRDGLNHVFRVVWSPDIVMMERRQNSTSMHDRHAKTTAHHRALTLEDEAGASSSRPVKCPLLGRRLRHACERIVQHAANVSAWRMRLTRLVLHFKLDEADRLCFLWCSSLRTSPGIEHALEAWLRSAKELPPAELQAAELGRRGFMRLMHRRPPQK